MKIYINKGILGLRALGLLCLLSFNLYSKSGTNIKGHDVTSSLSQSTQVQLGKALKNYQVFTIDAGSLYNSVKVSNPASAEANISSFNLELGNVNYNLTLKPRDFTGNDVKIFSSSENGVRIMADLPTETYQGYANNDPSQIAAFSIRSTDFEGVIESKAGEKFYIEPLQNVVASAESNANTYVFYNVNDANAEVMNCAYTEAENELQNYPVNVSEASQMAGPVGFRVGLFCDKLYADKRGASSSRAATSMLNTLNMVEALFYAPASPKGLDFHFRVTLIYVSGANEITQDNQLNIVTILANFRDWANAKTTPFTPADYDIASFWTPRSMTGPVQNPAGQAYGPNPGGACSANKYNVLRSNFQWSCPLAYAVDQAHEMGHNLNCAHTTVTGPPPTDIMQPSIYQSANAWHSSSVSSINGFINANSACIKARTTFAPEPNFTSDKVYGCGGSATVAFTNTTDFTDAATTYVWDFGDGTPTSTTASPSHTYTAEGKYTVTLTATNSNGSAVKTKTSYIWVGGAANASQIVPVNRNTTAGAYDVASATLWRSMEFKTLDDIELVSFNMDPNIAGTRLLYLTADSGFTLIDSKEFNLTQAKVLTKVDLNWRLQKGRKYIIYLQEDGTINGKQYYNQCYRINVGSNNFYGPSGLAYIPGVVEFTGNQLSIDHYYTGAAPQTNSSSWYVGFDWEFKKLCNVTVGINEEKKDNMFDVFPNPGNGSYTARFLNPLNANATIEVFSVLGEKVFTKKAINQGTITNESIDLINLAAGTYLLKLNTGDRQYEKVVIKADK